MPNTLEPGIRVFHATNQARQILTYGFRDDYVGDSPVNEELIGVLLTSAPSPSTSYGSRGRQIVQIVLTETEGAALDEFLVRGTRSKEWCVPASVLNTLGTVRLLTQDQINATLTGNTP